MTAMTRVVDGSGRGYRICSQKNPVTCGPAACLIMWANVNGSDPLADEGGVIELSKKLPDPWTQRKGANISNLVRVLAQMGVSTTLQRHLTTAALKTALYDKVAEKKPALAFLEWEGAASVVGHFVVVGRAQSGASKFTVLDPMFRMVEFFGDGMPFYYPTDTDSLKFSGAVAVMG